MAHTVIVINLLYSINFPDLKSYYEIKTVAQFASERMLLGNLKIWLYFSVQKQESRSLLARKETEFLRLKRSRIGKEDFDSLKVVGRGAFGEVRCKNVLCSHTFP